MSMKMALPIGITNKMDLCLRRVFICCVLCITLTASISAGSPPPNIVFILTDDQDIQLGGETPMVKTNKLIGDQGIIFQNMFVSSPLCCPSRSSIMTGKFVHNHNAINNSVSGNCSSESWQRQQESKAFPVYLKNRGYSTFFAGKYLNQYGYPDVGGVEHVPPGWDSWNGLVGNSVYYNYTLSINGKAEVHKDNYTEDYLTDVINRKATDFLNKQSSSTPFFIMMSTPACHGPFTPAPQFNNSFANNTAPRNGSFNVHGSDKHWLINHAVTPMPNDTIQFIDNIFRNRWRTLLSVDAMVENIMNILEKKNLLNNTYVFFSSDNGYHLGQFSLSFDKRQLYEFDIRVPLMVRGPGIKPAQTRKDVVMNIDLAPTFVQLSGQTIPSDIDGKSLLTLLHPKNKTKTFRVSTLIEHSGEHRNSIDNCPQYKNQGMDNCDMHCVCEDSWNNTYACVRVISPTENYKYCELADSVNFVEVYDLSKDPDEMKNIWKTADPQILATLSKQLRELSVCAGQSCRRVY